MSPFADDLHEAIERVPRASGDEPFVLGISTVLFLCSPRERG